MASIRLNVYQAGQTALEAVGMVSDYIALIWSTRWNAAGDFELILDATSPAAAMVGSMMYLERDDQPGKMMIVETTRYELAEDGSFRKICTGTDVFGLFRRRVTKYDVTYPDNSVVNDWYGALLTAAVQSEQTARFPVRVEVDAYIAYTAVAGVGIIPAGTNLLEQYTTFNDTWGYGVSSRVSAETTFANKPFYVNILPPTDSAVILSETNDMVRAFSATAEDARRANRMFVGGEQTDNPADRVFATVNFVQPQTPFGIVDQYVDASSVRRESGMTEAHYRAALGNAGIQAREPYAADVQLSLDVSALRLPQDLALGASVKIETRVFNARARLMEIIDSVGENGNFTQTPTFSLI